MQKKAGRKPTIHDVARETGVSIATVSNVLKGKLTEVSDATVERILKTVEQLGYVKNLTASSLSSRKSHLIAVITVGAFNPEPAKDVPSINPFYGEFVFRLEHEARARGYALVLYAGREEESLHFLLQRNVDAAVLVGITQGDARAVATCQDVPLVLFDGLVDTPHAMNVRGDEVRGGEISAQHLVAQGRRKLAFLGDVSERPLTIPALRFGGARRACESAGVPLELVWCETSFEEGERAAGKVNELGVDGVVTAADILAAGLMRGLARAGRAVPADVAVMGYDDLLVARLVKPALSTIDQRLDDKVTAVMDLIESGAPGDARVIEPRLVVRESA
ncbi:MAG: LacI family DNA-binding transcriptional regulator [Kiritimatiellae bacterium]|nr:LacI family DNA-binding transcriptional regulator [Kiritimatiellia bacterium]